MSVADRFWPKVERKGPDECWDWTACKERQGYGRFCIRKGVVVYAHRFAYEVKVGPIPDGLVIDHLCHNRACVNPAHLEPVEQGENARRGRNANSAKTHCLRGHALSGDNLRIRTDGGRRCRECARITKKAAS